MAHLIGLKTHTDSKGSLTVIEVLPFQIKRVFYIYGVDDSVRGGHRHKKTNQAVICLKGSCDIYNCNGIIEQTFKLDSPDKCLILFTNDWHKMYNFAKDTMLLVLASERFNKKDYIFEPYEK